ncbi:FERM, ARHGEF and pleckstrin domain-containing protein 2-like isoform X2 [Corticium candelabrum]|uniref:FERM, ARHGEF and pleckstrin domain-containing protein 2-like isoform X2 n=1 Tax=Corticium candelabrum TaxID=121492 RepID=UPI002E253C84|nr:FERM, ARHGEF and pleckstrin domain-containing protein 2-like isoform X2 [Corticium candelabrum]
MILYCSHKVLFTQRTSCLYLLTEEREEEMERFHQSVQCRGLSPSDCDRHILQVARVQLLYGLHLYSAEEYDGYRIELGIGCKGLLVYRRSVLINTFIWSCVKKSFAEKEIFFVELKTLGRRDQIGFLMETKEEAKAASKFFAECYDFYTSNYREAISSRSSLPVSLPRNRKSSQSNGKKGPQRSLSTCSATPVAAPNHGMFDLTSTYPRSIHPIRAVNLRHRAVHADKNECSSCLSPSPLRELTATVTSNSSKAFSFDDKDLFVCPEEWEDRNELIIANDNVCTLEQGGNESLSIDSINSMGRVTPDAVDIPDVDINQVVRALSEEKNESSDSYNFVACELRDTERSYCADLQLLNVKFRLQLVMANVLSPRQISELFGNLSFIHDFSNNFLFELEERIILCDADPEKYNYRYQIGDILKTRMASMKLYTSYVKNESKIFELVSHWQRENSEFNRLCSQFESDEACHRPLYELLYRPFQRMIHYKELMKRLIRYSEEQDDCNDVKEALLYLEKALEHVNESTRAAENTRKMIRIQREVIGVRNVLQPGRTLIMEGSLLKVESKMSQVNHFFLFCDILLYAVERSGLSGVQLVARGVLPLDGMKIESGNEGDGDDTTSAFVIITDTTMFTVIADSTRQKKLWTMTLTETIAQCNSSSADIQLPAVSVDRPSSDSVIKSISNVKSCMSCDSKFHIFRKRWMCDTCYKVVCKNCLDERSSKLSDNEKHMCVTCSAKAKRRESLSVTQTTVRQSSRQKSSPQRVRMSKISSALTLRTNVSNSRLSEQTNIASPERKPPNPLCVTPSNLLLSLRSSSFSKDSEMSGYLFRKARGKGGWKKFWVVVSQFSLCHYKNHNDSVSVSRTVPVDYELAFPDVDDVEAVGCMYVFKLSCGPRVLFYMAESKCALDRWIEILSLCVKRSRVHRQLSHLSKHPISPDDKQRCYTVC